MTPADRLSVLARVARLREDRAQRAWRAAVTLRQERTAEHAAAAAAHRRALDRHASAVAGLAEDPAGAQAQLWRRVTQGAADQCSVSAEHAGHALAAARTHAEHEARACREREVRRERADELVGAALASARKMAENRADDEASDVYGGRAR